MIIIIIIIIPHYCYGARVLLIACCKYTRMDCIIDYQRIFTASLNKLIRKRRSFTTKIFVHFLLSQNVYQEKKKLLLFVLIWRRFNLRRLLLLFNFFLRSVFFFVLNEYLYAAKEVFVCRCFAINRSFLENTIINTTLINNTGFFFIIIETSSVITKIYSFKSDSFASAIRNDHIDGESMLMRMLFLRTVISAIDLGIAVEH